MTRSKKAGERGLDLQEFSRMLLKIALIGQKAFNVVGKRT